VSCITGRVKSAEPYPFSCFKKTSKNFGENEHPVHALHRIEPNGPSATRSRSWISSQDKESKNASEHFEHVAICVSDLGASSTAPQAYKSSCQSKPRRIGRISMKVCTTTEHKGLKNSHVLGSRQAWNCYPVPEYSSYQTRGKDRCQGYRLRMDPHVQRIAMGRAVEDRFQVPS
jgi:hypothetical protein